MFITFSLKKGVSFCLSTFSFKHALYHANYTTSRPMARPRQGPRRRPAAVARAFLASRTTASRGGSVRKRGTTTPTPGCISPNLTRCLYGRASSTPPSGGRLGGTGLPSARRPHARVRLTRTRLDRTRCPAGPVDRTRYTRMRLVHAQQKRAHVLSGGSHGVLRLTLLLTLSICP